LTQSIDNKLTGKLSEEDLKKMLATFATNRPANATGSFIDMMK